LPFSNFYNLFFYIFTLALYILGFDNFSYNKMTIGAVFNLLSADGKQDKLLIANGLLLRRLKMIEDIRANDPSVEDPTPTLLDVERTHVVFMHARFKPFAAVAFEYNTTGSASGPQTITSSASNSKILFNVQQFGDFIADMGIYVSLTAPTITRTDTLSSTTRANCPAARWCDYPGERIFSSLAFTVNGADLDRYDKVAYNFYRNYHVSSEKLAGYKRMMGQEAELNGFMRQPGVDRTGTSDTATGIAGNGADPSSHRIPMKVANGWQTPKTTLDNLTMIIPTMFFFNEDVRTSLASVAIPNGQRYVEATLAASTDLVGLVPRGSGTWAAPRGSLGSITIADIQLYANNLFVNPEVHDIIIARVGFTLVRVHRFQQQATSKSAEQIQLSQFKWPVEYIYFGLKLTEQETSTRHLDSWHLFSQRVCTAFDMEGALGSQQLITLTGTSHAIASGTGNVTGIGTSYDTQLTPGVTVCIGGAMGVVQASPAITATTFTMSPAISATAVAAQGIGYIVDVPTAEVSVLNSLVDTVAVQAHGIDLYKSAPIMFYNAYLPYQFGGQNVCTPADPGTAFINFSLFPKTFQPSGYVNISRAREFFVSWTSSIVTSNAPATAYWVGKAINFLLLSDGTAVLRYST
jgi:hypothetical protein